MLSRRLGADMIKALRCCALIILLGGIRQGHGQTHKPDGISYRYVQIPISGFVISHISLKRIRESKTEFLDIINIIINQDSAKKYLLAATRQQALPITWQFPQPQDELLITMAILPDEVTGLVEWEPVRLDSLRGRRLESFAAIARDCFDKTYAAKSNPYTVIPQTRKLDVKPVINRDGRFWTTHNVVLTEYFLLRNKATWFPDQADGVTINCWAKPIARAEVAHLQREINATMPVGRKPSVEGELAQKILLKEESNQIYSFWSIPPRVIHGGVADYGAGDFRFKPGVGLISGQYAAYFYPDSFGAGADGNSPFNTLDIKVLSAK